MLKGCGTHNLYIMKTKMKVGGVMVGLNGNLPVQKIPGSKGVMPGLNSKVSAQNVATGKSSGGVNTPPSQAMPSAMYGRTMKKGGMVKKNKK
jgi:hypothetical protein